MIKGNSCAVRVVAYAISIYCGKVSLKPTTLKKMPKSISWIFFGLGTVLGEEEALADRSLYQNTVEAMTAVDAYLISVEHFHYLCDHDHVFCRLLLTEVSRRMADSTARASFYALYPIRYAFEKLLDAQTHQNLELSKSDMASYLGIDIRSLNRLLKEHMNERKISR